MKLFKFEIRTKKKRRELDVLVHAETPADALEHLEKRFAGHEVIGFVELPEGTKHFVIAELEPGEYCTPGTCGRTYCTETGRCIFETIDGRSTPKA